MFSSSFYKTSCTKGTYCFQDETFQTLKGLFTKNEKNDAVKGTVSVILSAPASKYDNVQSTTVPLKA